MTIGKIHRSEFVRRAVSDALINPDNNKKLIDPFFLLRVVLA